LNPSETIPIGHTSVRVTRLGLGGASLGNLYSPISNEQAQSTIDRALDLGVRYIDTAPLYGSGLSEYRIGNAIKTRSPKQLTISTKVGRLLKPSASTRISQFPGSPSLEPYFDFSQKGIISSYESSLQRLGVSSADILLIHDPDDHLDQAIHHSYPALVELRSKGRVQAIGLGTNDWKKALYILKECPSLDCVLLAGRYTLLEQGALAEFLPYCLAKGIGVIIGGPFNSGILSSDLNSTSVLKYNYTSAPIDVLQKARRINAVCERFGVSLKAAALQFILAHPAIVSVIPGSRSPEEVEENFSLATQVIPHQLWEEMKQHRLIVRDSPTE